MSGQDHSGAGPVNARIFPIPPVVAGLFIGAGVALNWLVPLGGSALAGTGARIGGGLILACALAIAGLAFLEMRRHRTTFHPGHNAAALVTGGVFQRTRNPMYLSLTLVTLGLGVATANPWLDPARPCPAPLPAGARGEARGGLPHHPLRVPVHRLPAQGPPLDLAPAPARGQR